MKNLFFLLMLFMITSCNTQKGAYWCGDHPCINKKEKEAYFKKTMTVEIKSPKNENYKDKSEIKKVIKEAQLKKRKRINDEKNLTKQIKLEEKRRIKEEKNLAKQIKLEEKRRIKEEKNLAKQMKLEEKRKIKNAKKLSKRKIDINQEKLLDKSDELKFRNKNTEVKLGKLTELYEKITKKNTFRPYPDINDIPN